MCLKQTEECISMTVSLPGTAERENENSCRARAYLINLEFLALPFFTKSKGLWSVCKVKCFRRMNL